MPKNVSHTSDGSSGGHSSALVANLCTLGKNGHGNVPSFKHCGWKGT
jgi:hypothetical protein